MKKTRRNTTRKGATVAAGALFVFAITACDADERRLHSMQIGDRNFQIEIAQSAEERRTGLMHREELPEDHGMLFIFARDDHHSFWMKNTYIPLSIAFIDREGCIRDIQTMRPESRRRIAPPVPVRYALEVNEGAFREAGVSEGVCLELPEP